MYLITLFAMPLLTMSSLLFTPRFNMKKLEKYSMIWSGLLVAYFILILVMSKENLEFQYNISWNWFANWGLITLSMDGMSMFFMGLSILLMPMCMMMSLNSVKSLKKEFLILLFSMLFILMGVFTILDILGFYILF